MRIPDTVAEINLAGPVRRFEPFVGAVIDRNDKVAPVVRKVRAPGCGKRGLHAVALARDAVAGVNGEPFVVILHDEVDNAGYGVCPVNGRSAACQDFHTFNEAHGYRAYVHRG